MARLPIAPRTLGLVVQALERAPGLWPVATAAATVPRRTRWGKVPVGYETRCHSPQLMSWFCRFRYTAKLRFRFSHSSAPPQEDRSGASAELENDERT